MDGKRSVESSGIWAYIKAQDKLRKYAVNLYKNINFVIFIATKKYLMQLFRGRCINLKWVRAN
jgi:hypothetical protein